ncbi:MAG: 1-acyl-sn-glycerol-3-phosphate acyltransferase [Firmicutes bacterium]|nr:1-acyl-sn-glycerol-3-phosphate acyltransferase [Bacillota bacterium]
MLYKIVRLIIKPFLFIFYNIKVEGIDNIPKEDGYIVCGNHIKAIDPILMAAALPCQIHFMAKNELFKNPLLGALLKAVGAFSIKRGEPDLKSIRTSLKLLRNNKNIGIFPEGTRNISDELKAEPGIAMLSIKSKKGILPVSIKSSYKLFKKTRIIVGDVIYLNEFYDIKLKNNDYINISLEIMKKIRSL